MACARVAILLRAELERRALTSAVKTSGSLGLHVYVPLNGAVHFAEAKAFARRLARKLTDEHPAGVVDRNARALRTGKVLVDWLQNDPSRSMVAPYSLRALPWPAVSTPISWHEVMDAAETGRAEALTFTAHDVPARIEEHGDLFAEALAARNSLPAD